MEGHLGVPVDEQSIYMELQKNWVQRYFRTRDGRLQWFAVSVYCYYYCRYHYHRYCYLTIKSFISKEPYHILTVIR